MTPTRFAIKLLPVWDAARAVRPEVNVNAYARANLALWVMRLSCVYIDFRSQRDILNQALGQLTVVVAVLMPGVRLQPVGSSKKISHNVEKSELLSYIKRPKRGCRLNPIANRTCLDGGFISGPSCGSRSSPTIDAATRFGHLAIP